MGTIDESKDSESNKQNLSDDSIEGRKSTDVYKPSSSKSLKKKETTKSSFYPQAKGLAASQEANSSINDSKIVVSSDNTEDVQAQEVEKEPEEMKIPEENIKAKLSHDHITQFYPYENNDGDESKEKVIKKTVLERVQTATENQRYKRRSQDLSAKKPEEPIFGSTIQRNALMNLKNKEHPKLNQLMNSEENPGDVPPFGVGYGKNPRLKTITEEEKRARVKINEPLNLNVTSFYDSESSRIENIKAKEDQEAKEVE